MSSWLPPLLAALLGFLGGILVQRFEYKRKDHEHRQGNYHNLLIAADNFRNAHIGNAPPQELAPAALQFAQYHRGIEVFGTERVRAAAAAFEKAVNDGRDPVAEREAMVEAMRADVGPRRWWRLRGRSPR